MPKFALFFLLLLFVVKAFSQPKNIAEYNVVWNTPSQNSSGSMPCGGGDIGLNVWVEGGDVFFYLSRSGTFDENNAMLKLGRIRIKLSSNPFSDAGFKQELCLQDGSVAINGKNTQIKIWVDVYRPVVHVEIKSSVPQKTRVMYESWRYTDHEISGEEFRANSYRNKQIFPVITYKDSIGFKNDAVVFYHRNRSPNIFEHTLKVEGLHSLKDSLFNPVKNRTFGGMMRGDGMKPAGNSSGKYAETNYRSWILESVSNVKNQGIEIGLNVGQTETLKASESCLEKLMAEAKSNKKTARKNSINWWANFWNRSFIFTGSDDKKADFLGRNYQLFRYQLACNAFGEYPTKFNGGLFTFDPVFVDKKYSYSPDFRLWGGGTMTAQNQRLVYFPMIKSGDFDMMKPQFDFYLRSLKNAEMRTRFYWKHSGASFTEQMENFGLPNAGEYLFGGKRPPGLDPGIEYNEYLEYVWETAFEFCLMILETERYEGQNIRPYIPLIESCLSFYDEHYRYLAAQRSAKVFDDKNKYVFYPTSAAETYKMAYNSTTVISALKVILERMLQLPEKNGIIVQQKRWQKMLSQLPDIPLRNIAGHTVLAPAEAWARLQNVEAPQLYPVYPWGIFGIGKPGLDTALNTWKYDPDVQKHHSYIGWKQDNIFAARLGLTAEAANLTAKKLADGPHRFPTFWGPGFDWTPDHNWGGTAMIGLQEMLMQVDDRKIYLLSAWPKAWNVHFKLHAPYKTTVEAEVKNGKIVKLIVLPKSREKDVVLLNQ